MKMILTVLLAYGVMVVSWVLYLAVMNLKEHRDKLSPIAKAHAYVLLAVALVVDLVLTVIIGTALFLDWPRELTLTGRLKRYHQLPPAAWRYRLARWICTRLLDQFDPNGKHC